MVLEEKEGVGMGAEGRASPGALVLVEDNSDADLPPGVIRAVRGRAGMADVVTANRRRYPLGVYRKVVDQFRARAPREEVLGELDHPEALGSPKLEKTAMRIVDLQLAEDGGLDFGAHVLDTPAGRTLAGLLRAGVVVNVSTRGAGSLSPCCGAHEESLARDGNRSPDRSTAEGRKQRRRMQSDHQPHLVVGENYELHGIDAVTRGAQPAAYIHHAAGRTAGEGEIMNDRITEEAPERIVETPERIVGTPPGAREPETETDQVYTDAEVLQAAGAEEQATLQAALNGLESGLAARFAQHEAELAALRQKLREAEEARDLAVDQLNRSRAAEQAGVHLAHLRPDVRRSVEAELASSRTPEEVAEQWKSIQRLLAGVGITPVPAGVGQPDNGEQPRRHPGRETLTAVQRLQQQLLGIA